jgi:hypothetical protein
MASLSSGAVTRLSFVLNILSAPIPLWNRQTETTTMFFVHFLAVRRQGTATGMGHFYRKVTCSGCLAQQQDQ